MWEVVSDKIKVLLKRCLNIQSWFVVCLLESVMSNLVCRDYKFYPQSAFEEHYSGPYLSYGNKSEFLELRFLSVDLVKFKC